MIFWMMRLIKSLLGRRALLYVGIVYTLLITIFFFTPVPEEPLVDIPYLDKYAHIALHALLILIWLIYFSLGDQSHFSSKFLMLALITCFFYGIVVEAFQQWFTETRTFDFLDILANTAGDLLGLFTFMLIRKRQRDES